MRIPLPPIRPLLYLVVAAALVGGGIDGGSVILARLSLPDDAVDVGHAAAASTDGHPATQQTAAVAFEAARRAAAPLDVRVRPDDFTLYPDGRVTVTATRTAPTLLLHRLPVLRDVATVTATETVGALPYS